MLEFPETINPDSEQRLMEKLMYDDDKIKLLDYIRGDMRALYLLEQKFKNGHKNTRG
jgi:hypothetical protein